MEDLNKVTVKIYGQEYTISGSLSSEKIFKIAKNVDTKMFEASSSMPYVSTNTIAVLSAVNISGEYFEEKEKRESLEVQTAKLNSDVAHFEQLWEEAKSSFIKYKEEAQENAKTAESMRKQLEEVSEELSKLKNDYVSLEKKYNSILNINEELSEKVRSNDESQESVSENMKELEDRCNEMENSFFDIQMENIRLKSELDKLKKNI